MGSDLSPGSDVLQSNSAYSPLPLGLFLCAKRAACVKEDPVLNPESGRTQEVKSLPDSSELRVLLLILLCSRFHSGLV